MSDQEIMPVKKKNDKISLLITIALLAAAGIFLTGHLEKVWNITPPKDLDLPRK